MIKIASKLPGMRVKSFNPKFDYKFDKADVPLEMPKDHADKVLKNSNFFISKESIEKPKKPRQASPKQAKPWYVELNEIEGITKKDVGDIVGVYRSRSDLLKKLSKGNYT